MCACVSVPAVTYMKSLSVQGAGVVTTKQPVPQLQRLVYQHLGLTDPVAAQAPCNKCWNSIPVPDWQPQSWPQHDTVTCYMHQHGSEAYL